MTTPAEYTLKLAQLKAVAVAATEKRAVVIGCDSVLTKSFMQSSSATRAWPRSPKP